MSSHSLAGQRAKSKWRSGMAGAGQAYTAGVQATTKDPTQLAAQAVDDGRYLAGVTAGQARMAARLRAAGKSAWLEGCTKTGAQRLASGATKGGPKYDAAIDKLVPIWDQMKAASDAVGPRGGLAQAQAKSAAALAALMQGVGKA